MSSKKMKGTWDLKATKIIMVGYLPIKSRDTYKFYSPATRKIVKSRNARWIDWKDGNQTLDQGEDSITVNLDMKYGVPVGPAQNTHMRTH